MFQLEITIVRLKLRKLNAEIVFFGEISRLSVNLKIKKKSISDLIAKARCVRLKNIAKENFLFKMTNAHLKLRKLFQNIFL